MKLSARLARMEATIRPVGGLSVTYELGEEPADARSRARGAGVSGGHTAGSRSAIAQNMGTAGSGATKDIDAGLTRHLTDMSHARHPDGDAALGFYCLMA